MAFSLGREAASYYSVQTKLATTSGSALKLSHPSSHPCLLKFDSKLEVVSGDPRTSELLTVDSMQKYDAV